MLDANLVQSSDVIQKIALTLRSAQGDKDKPLNWTEAARFILELKKAIEKEDHFRAGTYARIKFRELGLPFCQAANIDQSKFVNTVKAVTKFGIDKLSADITVENLAYHLEHGTNMPLEQALNDRTSRTMLRHAISAGLAQASPVVVHGFVKPIAIGYAANCAFSAAINGAINGTFSSSSLPPMLPSISAPVFVANLGMQKIVKPSSVLASIGLSYATTIAVNYLWPEAPEIPYSPIVSCATNLTANVLFSYRNSIARTVQNIGTALVEASQDYNDALYGYADESRETPALR